MSPYDFCSKRHPKSASWRLMKCILKGGLVRRNWGPTESRQSFRKRQLPSHVNTSASKTWTRMDSSDQAHNEIVTWARRLAAQNSRFQFSWTLTDTFKSWWPEMQLLDLDKRIERQEYCRQRFGTTRCGASQIRERMSFQQLTATNMIPGTLWPSILMGSFRYKTTTRCLLQQLTQSQCERHRNCLCHADKPFKGSTPKTWLYPSHHGIYTRHLSRNYINQG